MATVNPLRQFQTFTSWLDNVQHRTSRIYDTLYSHHNRELIEHLVVYLAIIGFFFHLLVIFLARTIPQLSLLTVVFGANYLEAISTPFNFILFYEVLLMVLVIPESTTRAVGTQFEIISLIVLRNVFKNLAEFESLAQIENNLAALRPILIDMGGGLGLFLLVTIFYHVSRSRTSPKKPTDSHPHALDDFVARKKILAVLLSGLLFVLAAFDMGAWGADAYQALATGASSLNTSLTGFYEDLFTVLIFTDVLILILSLLVSNNYQLVVRNAGFVIATILLRISLSVSSPYDVIIALIAVLFSILVLLIYKHCAFMGLSHEPQH